MSPEVVAAWVAAGIALVVGVIGWVFAGIANGRAEKANKLAAEANRHAAAAVDAAEHANRVAEAANELSEKTHSIIDLEARQRVEQWITELSVEWDADRAGVVFTNEGRDPALDPTVTINGKHLREAWDGTGEQIARGEPLRLEFPELIPLRIEHNRKAKAEWQASRGDGIITFPMYWKDKLDIVVTWHTRLGQPREQRLELKIR